MGARSKVVAPGAQSLDVLREPPLRSEAEDRFGPIDLHCRYRDQGAIPYCMREDEGAEGEGMRIDEYGCE